MAARVSVIVTCYNLGEYLHEAIDSVFAQTYPHYDVLIVDDGSTDPVTCEVLRRVDSVRTPVVRTGNQGLPAARNTGIRQTSGDVICCLDADDCLEPEWFERGVALLESRPEFGYASHWLRAFGEEEWPWQPMRCDLGMLLDVNTLNGAALFRRSLWEAVGGFDETMRDGCEDWEFWIRATSAGHRGAIVPEVMHAYRRRAESMSRTMNQSRLYADLIERHPGAYCLHFLDLLLRREHSIAGLQHSIEVMQAEVDEVLTPALAERDREIVSARKRLAEASRVRSLEDLAQERQRVVDEQAASLSRTQDQLRHSRWETGEQSRRADWLAAERATLLERVAELEARAQDATTREAAREREVGAMRRSWSWRLTAPLRQAGAAIGRPTRPS